MKESTKNNLTNFGNQDPQIGGITILNTITLSIILKLYPLTFMSIQLQNIFTRGVLIPTNHDRDSRCRNILVGEINGEQTKGGKPAQ